MKNLIKAYHKAYPAVKGAHGVECDTCGARVEGDKPYVAVLCFDCWSKAGDSVVVRVVKRVYKDIVVVPKGKKVTKATLFRLAQEEGLNGWQEVKGSGTAEEIG